MQKYFPNNNFQIFNNISFSNCQHNFEAIDQEIFQRSSPDLPNAKFENSKEPSTFSPEHHDDEFLSSKSFTSSIFSNPDFEIKCLNFQANCKWKGRILDLIDHLSKDCPGKQHKIVKNCMKDQKKQKMIKCLFYENECQKFLYKHEYAAHLINEHCEEIFCSVKKFDFMKEEKNRCEKNYKRLLRGVLWADFYQKKAIEKLNKENKLLRKKLKEIEEAAEEYEKQDEKKEEKKTFKAFLSNNSETVAGRGCKDISKILGGNKMFGD